MHHRQEFHLAGTKGRRGKPRNNLLKKMENLIARRGMNFENAKNVARNRKQWKKQGKLEDNLKHPVDHRMQLHATYIFLKKIIVPNTN